MIGCHQRVLVFAMERSSAKHRAFGAVMGKLQPLVSFATDQDCEEAVKVLVKVLARAEEEKAAEVAEVSGMIEMDTKDLIKEALKEVTPRKGEGFFLLFFCSHNSHARSN